MRHLATILCGVYLVILSAGLFLPDPFAVTGEQGAFLRGLYWDVFDPFGHLGAFAVLGFLCCAAGWPRRVAARLGLAIAYALASEPLQAFFPPRMSQLSDLVQDLIGLALGAVGWGALTLLWRGIRPATEREQQPEDREQPQW